MMLLTGVNLYQSINDAITIQYIFIVIIIDRRPRTKF